MYKWTVLLLVTKDRINVRENDTEEILNEQTGVRRPSYHAMFTEKE